jgi:hypothetical protein
VRGALRATIAGPPVDGVVPIPPRTLAIAKRLPAETVSYLAYATGADGQPGIATKLWAQLAAVTGRRDVRGPDPALGGLDAAQLLDALGGEGVAGFTVRAGAAPKAWDQSGALVVLQDVADAKVANGAIAIVKSLLGKKGAKVKVRAEAGGFSATTPDPKLPYVRVRLAKSVLFVGLGQRDVVDHALATLDSGKDALGDDGAHARALEGVPASSGYRLWVDTARVAALLSAMSPEISAQMTAEDRAWFEGTHGPLTGADRPTTAFAFSAIPDASGSGGLRLEVDQAGSVTMLGALAFYGVRRYLHSAKTAEAKNTIGAITRAAVAAYERESFAGALGSPVLHKLCKSAPSVPSAVPRGVKYASQSSDWQTGDDLTGWRCLKFEMSSPQYFRYTYTQGGPYLGPARGGPDPGPDGFEVAAEGDLDGNGKTSLFTRIGKIDSGVIRLSTAIFIDHEEE